MESKFGCYEQKIVVLQDHKRLPARFFACVSGALSSRISWSLIRLPVPC